jgi:D-glycero-D-manno-heptose 1,7-bisphosphate phosphatase
MKDKAVFLDRDGVINKEVNYLYKIDEFEFIEGVFEACYEFIQKGYKLIIITNQSGIAKGIYKENDYRILTKWMKMQFKIRSIDILDVFFCPHNPSSNCECRKPMPGMFFKSFNKYKIDASASWMIGDKESDIQAANNAGIENTIIVKSGHKIDTINSKAKYIIDSINESIEIIE